MVEQSDVSRSDGRYSEQNILKAFLTEMMTIIIDQIKWKIKLKAKSVQTSFFILEGQDSNLYFKIKISQIYSIPHAKHLEKRFLTSKPCKYSAPIK